MNKGKKKRSADWLCLLLALIPSFGFFAFLYMGEKSGRKSYTRFGKIYAWGTVIILVLFVLFYGVFVPIYKPGAFEVGGFAKENAFFQFVFHPVPLFAGTLSWGFGGTRTILGFLDLAIRVSKTVLQLACLIHTFLSAPGYLRYMREVAAYRTPYRHPLLEDKKWCRRQKTYFWWLLFLPLSPAALVLAGKRSQRQAMVRNGKNLCIVQGALWLYVTVFSPLRWGSYSFVTSDLFCYCQNVPSSVAGALLFLIPFGCFLYLFMKRKETLYHCAVQYEQDVARYPFYAQRRWQRANSRYRILTFLPFAGGLGIIRAGTLSGNPKLRRQGFLLLALCAAVMVLGVLGYGFLGERINAIADYGVRYYLRFCLVSLMYPINVFQILLTGIAALIGSCCLRDVLLSRAETIGGYYGELEREIAMNRRWDSRQTDLQGANPAPEISEPYRPVSEIPEIRTDPVQWQAEVSAGGGIIDINTCSKEELLRLPGVYPAEAARAMDYRQENGAFSSVDEFVLFLQIKPHFAVRIFEMAEASHVAVPFDGGERGGTMIRRRIDF